MIREFVIFFTLAEYFVSNEVYINLGGEECNALVGYLEYLGVHSGYRPGVNPRSERLA